MSNAQLRHFYRFGLSISISFICFVIKLISSVISIRGHLVIPRNTGAIIQYFCQSCFFREFIFKLVRALIARDSGRHLPAKWITSIRSFMSKTHSIKLFIETVVSMEHSSFRSNKASPHAVDNQLALLYSMTGTGNTRASQCNGNLFLPTCYFEVQTRILTFSN